MLLTRRHLLSATGVAAGALLLPATPATARTAPEDWSGWLRENRDRVAAVLDDGRGGRFAHHPEVPRPLTTGVVHLAAYAHAVEAGRVTPDDPLRVGDWERYRLGPDGGAHLRALAHLGLRCTDGRVADDPRAAVTLGDLVAVTTRFGDDAAADCLRDRLGEAALRAAAARHGWPAAPTTSALGDALRVVLGRRVADEDYLRDPRLRLEALGGLPDATWTGRARTGTAAGLHRLHRSLAATTAARAHLADHQGLRARVTADVLTIEGVVRHEDGTLASAAVLAHGVDAEWAARAESLVGLVSRTLLEPGTPSSSGVDLS
ncbi:serine hydrolase [Actinosynnema sp. NPDC020468]|uniref:serine hydrolase n=1 Tax=Actinosynnema sp. NPDC020468 TaxID=3154488 RepID=UPI0033F00F05